MIPRTAPLWQTSSWQKALSEAITQPEELVHYLELEPELLPAAKQAAEIFGLRVPRGYADLMEKGNPNDPLLRQILPIGEELETTPGFSHDPVGDLAASPNPGLLHKYQGRALLISSGACAIHCRFCFRRHFPYGDAVNTRQQSIANLGYLSDNREIQEVILSGGDPLMLSDTQLAKQVETLEAIPHLKRLRIHSRMPIVLPERVTQPLLDLLSSTRLQVILVTHCNHPNELGPMTRQALEQLRNSPVTGLNQSVLLRGVNDHPDTLIRLSETLFDLGFLPYYLHLLDRVQGAAHFEVNLDHVRKLEKNLRAQLPGYLVPKIVQELAGGEAKTPLAL